MKQLLGFLFLLFNYSIFYGQERYNYEFEKLATTDTIVDKEQIRILKTESEYNYPSYFVVGRYFEGENDKEIFCLIKEENNYWVSYAISNEYGFGFGSVNIIGPAANKNYFLVSSYYNYLSHGGGHGNENTIKELIIIDIENNSSVQLESYTRDYSWQFAEDGEAYDANNEDIMVSNYVFDTNFLTIVNTCFINQNIETCLNPGGLYEFSKEKLKKIKNYNAEKMGFVPIQYIGEIAIGMTLEDLKLVYPNGQIFKKENTFGTCAEAKIGFEVWDENTLLGFAITKPIRENSGNSDEEIIDYANEKIINFLVLSVTLNVGKINTNSTASEVLKMYPKANVRLDLLSEWEHIYLKELNSELVFKTNDSNRIGVYKNEIFVKLKNKNAKIDFIVVGN